MGNVEGLTGPSWTSRLLISCGDNHRFEPSTMETARRRCTAPCLEIGNYLSLRYSPLFVRLRFRRFAASCWMA